MSDEQFPTRVLIVEDENIVRKGLRRLLEDLPDFEIVGDTEFGEEAIEIVQDQAPDVVLLDMVLLTSQLSGLDTLKQIVRLSPSTRVVVLSAHSDESIVFPALQAGAIGYTLKSAPLSEISEAILDGAHGRYHIDPVITKKLIERTPAAGTTDHTPSAESVLTRREREILPFLLKGYTNQEIADELSISRATVKTHVSNILNKLGVPDRAHLSLKIAQQNNTKPPE
jgi:DNA-binding NarL/FixJ family response regulator